jgi:hypothetical protein
VVIGVARAGENISPQPKNTMPENTTNNKAGDCRAGKRIHD